MSLWLDLSVEEQVIIGAGLLVVLLFGMAVTRIRRKRRQSTSLVQPIASAHHGLDGFSHEALLLEVEEALVALRELYSRRLISAEIYVAESRKIALRLRDESI
jgi:hypothetical protein